MIGIKINTDDKYAYISMNYRHIIENDWLDDLQYLCEPTEYHEKRYTVKFITDIGVAREFFRHRAFSMAQESTRYCNYSKDKFNNELTFIIPPWLNLPEGQYIYWDNDWCDMNKMRIQIGENNHDDINTFLWSLNNAQNDYNSLINKDWKPQQARCVLPLNLKSEAIMTGFASDWKHFFKLRTSFIAATGAPHPQAAELANPLYLEFIDRKYINDLKG